MMIFDQSPQLQAPISRGARADGGEASYRLHWERRQIQMRCEEPTSRCPSRPVATGTDSFACASALGCKRGRAPWRKWWGRIQGACVRRVLRGHVAPHPVVLFAPVAGHESPATRPAADSSAQRQVHTARQLPWLQRCNQGQGQVGTVRRAMTTAHSRTAQGPCLPLQ